MELQKLIGIAKRRGWMVIATALIAALAAFVFARMQTPVYKSTMRLTVQPARPDLGLTQSGKTLLASSINIIWNKRNAAKVVERLNLDTTAETVYGNTKMAEDAAVFGVTIEVQDYSGETANRIAKTWADLFVETRRNDNTKLQRTDQIDVILGDDPNYVKDYPRTSILTAAAGLLGALCGGLVAAVLEGLQSSILRTQPDVERKLGLPVIGAIPAIEKQG